MKVSHPKSLFVLASVELWNRFSHYGMRSLLILYMVGQLHFSDSLTFGIFASFCALTELGSILGGILADRYLGLRRSVMVGGWLIGIGHLLLSLKCSFFGALSFIVTGSSLYTTNVASLLGLCYQNDPKKQEEGFTLFYMAINAGALCSSLFCGFLATTFGFHIGFGLAAIGMIISNLTLCFFKKDLPETSVQRKDIQGGLILSLFFALSFVFIFFSQYLFFLIPIIGICALGFLIKRLDKQQILTRENIKKLLIYLGSFILFYGAQEMISSCFVLFSDRATDHLFLGIFKVPITLIMAMNPITIICLGPLINRILRSIKGPKTTLRMILPLGLSAFVYLFLSCATVVFSVPISFSLIILLVSILSMSELMIGPAMYNECSNTAPKEQKGLIMSIVAIGFSLAASIGGIFSKMMAIDTSQIEMLTYTHGFFIVGLIALIGAISFGYLLLRKKEQKNLVSIK